MAAENIADIGIDGGSVEAGCGAPLVIDVAPTLGLVGTGMHQQHRLGLQGEWQVIEPGALRRMELLVRPNRRAVTNGLDLGGRRHSHGIVIALKHHRALLGEQHDALDNGGRVCTVTDQIPQKCKALGPLRPGMGDTGF